MEIGQYLLAGVVALRRDRIADLLVSHSIHVDIHRIPDNRERYCKLSSTDPWSRKIDLGMRVR